MTYPALPDGLNEKEIVWLKDPSAFPWLREFSTYDFGNRIAPPDERTVGYSVAVRKAGDRRGLPGRVWMSNQDDFLPGPYATTDGITTSGCPCEAVLPESICINKESRNAEDEILVRPRVVNPVFQTRKTS